MKDLHSWYRHHNSNRTLVVCGAPADDSISERESTPRASGAEGTRDENVSASLPRTRTLEATTKVAIIEDEKDLVQIYRYAIQELGYKEEFLGYDGDEVVEAMRNRSIHPDVIIMDYRMPKMNGLEAASKIREIDKSVKIILATADHSVISKATQMGLENLRKPFSFTELKAMLEPRKRPSD